MFCQFCGSPRLVGTKFCNSCGKFLEPPQVNPQRKQDNKLRDGAIAIAILVVLAVVIIEASSSNNEQNSKESPPSSALKNDESRDVGFIGNTYVITDPDGRNRVATVESQEAAEQIEDSGRKNDRYGFDQLVNSEHVTSVISGTKVLVLDLSVWHNWEKARILSGPRYGEIVYLERSWTKFTPASSDDVDSDKPSPSSTAQEQSAPSELGRGAQRIREAGDNNFADRIFSMQTEKAMRDCGAAGGPENCETGEELEPFRHRLVLFLVADKEAWLSPADEGFRTLRPASIDDQRHRAEILAESGDYSQTAIITVQAHIMPTDFLMQLYPSWTIPKLFYENKWSAIDDKQWCGDGCWMVWCEVKLDKPQNAIGPIAGYWEVNLNTKTIKVVDGSATARFFKIKN
jgi:hypothetical protein